MDDDSIQKAIRTLRRKDPVLRSVIDVVGKFRMSQRRQPFQSLARAIVGQQISGLAAKSIWSRLEQQLRPRRISAAALHGLSVQELRTAGVSPQKAGYLLDLATRCHDGRLRLSKLHEHDDESVISQLTDVRGIGVWTAQMFLMFSLARPDVFPADDLGIRRAIRDLYRLDDYPDSETSHEIASNWSPYRTIACWYLWRSGEPEHMERLCPDRTAR